MQRAGACPHGPTQAQPALLLQTDPLLTPDTPGRARAQLMPLRARWEQHLLPTNRSTITDSARQFINPDVSIVPSSIEQEMMELRGISLLNAASRKSELQAPCCWWHRGKTSQRFSLFQTGFKHQNACLVWGKIWREQAPGRCFISISLSYTRGRQNPFPRARGVSSQLCHPLPTLLLGHLPPERGW